MIKSVTDVLPYHYIFCMPVNCGSYLKSTRENACFLDRTRILNIVNNDPVTNEDGNTKTKQPMENMTNF